MRRRCSHASGSGNSWLTASLADELFAKGQPLDAAEHFIIIPDAIGVGRSSKPSDGLRARFPHYRYADTVRAEHQLVTEHLNVRHLRLVLGSSMGGMQTWMWGYTYPDLMDGLVPLASQPIGISGRNWINRRIRIEAMLSKPVPAQATLTAGIEAAIVDVIPEIRRVEDVTDHAAGDNPYYEPSKA